MGKSEKQMQEEQEIVVTHLLQALASVVTIAEGLYAIVSNSWVGQLVLWQPVFWNVYWFMFRKKRSIRADVKAAWHAKWEWPTVLTLDMLATAAASVVGFIMKILFIILVVGAGVLSRWQSVPMQLLWSTALFTFGHLRAVSDELRVENSIEEQRRRGSEEAGESETGEKAKENEQEDEQGSRPGGHQGGHEGGHRGGGNKKRNKKNRGKKW